MIVVVLILAAVFGGMVGYLFKQTDQPKIGGTLVVAHDESEPPFMFLRINHDYRIPESGYVIFEVKHQYPARK